MAPGGCSIPVDGFTTHLPANAALGEREIHIVRAYLTASTTEISRYSGILSPDELQRASRFYFERHRTRYIVGRGLLRFILGTYIRADPSSIRFNYGLHGKPALITEPGLNLIQFNVSHSEDLALYALTSSGAIGVDTERIRDQSHLDDISRDFFSASECGEYFKLPRRERTEAFFRCWTRKEAFIKAIGDGLSYPLGRFDVSIEPGRARLLRLNGEPVQASQWSMCHLNPEQGYTGALAIKGCGFKVRGFHLECSAYSSLTIGSC
jgi:4'-phosphopantetheinyl transferase